MGRLSVNDVQALEEKGILNKKTVKEMQEEGLVSTRTRNTARYMKTANGKWVSPQLYFQGRKGSEPSRRMNDFRTEFNTLVTKYCTTKTK
mgnify:CR=1 FL=1|tara:strand:+ start:5260 stop:5529 length:270 start_codon:yes stop_codon:yes gene_type:complete